MRHLGPTSGSGCSRPPARLAALALVPGLVLAAGAACGTPAPGASPAPTVTVTATPTTAGSPSTTAPSSPGLPATSSPRVTAPPGPQGVCSAESLRVRYADDRGGAGAGSVTGTLTFTNTGSAACSLRGFPGVSYVTAADGSQVGQPATRTDDEATAVRLSPGAIAAATLRRTQPRNYGDACQETDVAGLRVYAPDATQPAFVKFPTTGCASTGAPLLQVGPVRKAP